MNNLLSYCGLVAPRISASDKILPVSQPETDFEYSICAPKKCPVDDPNYRLAHGKCLYINQAAQRGLTFFNARRLCTEKGGKLYEPKDLDEIKDFPDLLHPRNMHWAWIGITGINMTNGGTYLYNGKRLVDYFVFLIYA